MTTTGSNGDTKRRKSYAKAATKVNGRGNGEVDGGKGDGRKGDGANSRRFKLPLADEVVYARE